jgi:hypothetical protein
MRIAVARMLSRTGDRSPQLVWLAATDMLSFARLPQATLFSFGTHPIAADVK